MCVIIYKPAAKAAIPEHWLHNAIIENPHGSGLAARNVTTGEITVVRSLNDEEVLEAAAQYGEGYDVVYHARIGTSGTLTADNLHPFAVTDGLLEGAPVVGYLFHNGILKSWEQESKDHCDTWHMARQWSRDHGANIVDLLSSKTFRRSVVREHGGASKFVFVWPGGVRVLNAEAGVWEEGYWHSNYSAIDDPFERWHPKATATRLTAVAGGAWQRSPSARLAFDSLSAANNEPYGERASDEETAEHLVRAWEGAASVVDIEDTIYEYGAVSVADAIVKLLATRYY